ncbi:hypothetical protein [Cryobacterium sp. Y82]|uniref:hypothetical protein n=1 Tax=Cryobacterium sp. Y82 TaxID=2045017 RepID=UPI000CE352A7|nr:hypothetical protein [Cryobacterium sp. Y82]
MIYLKLDESPLWGSTGSDALSSVPGGAAQGLAAELLRRYRILYVPTPGAVLPIVPRIDAIVPDEIIKGVGYARLPSGILVTVGTATSPVPTSIALPRRGLSPSFWAPSVL